MRAWRKIDGISNPLTRVQDVLKFNHHSRAYLLLVVFASAGCQTSSAPKERTIGEAFAGPANLEIRNEIAPKSGTVTTVHYSDKLQILQKRRHFLKVRTPKGQEGWVDESMLLDKAAMQQVQQLSKNTEKYPTQGKATTYDLLNVHTDPSRNSPSYLQIQPGERVDVIGHKLTPRVSPPRKPLVIAPPKAPRPVKISKKSKSSKVQPPPAPSAPKPPPDWVTLSKERAPVPEETPAKQEPEPDPVAPDEWTLIRNSSNQSGWVLTRKIYMAIPDEVAQYAEGKRITSYFSLGKVPDESGPKDIWLWTTIDSGPHSFDFDSYRVFVWAARHHRYETAYIQRRLEGFFPVRASEGNFSVVIEKKDARRYRQNFELIGTRVHFANELLEP